ncbi:transposase [mine drainage metagenome]|uniref:Transposase n=1 Tax=mine drainage metagenome TaxID=410659 RepID=A0A1J5PTL0_9ZZZZ
MGKSYSTDLRQRVLDYVASGHSCRAAGRVFGVSASTAVRVAAASRAKGSLTPKRQGRAPGTAGKLAPYKLFLVELVQAEPDITLRELSGALSETYGVTAELSSIHRALIRAGLSYKKRPDRAGTRAG